MAKVPPPPYLTKDKQGQVLNRWLLELTSILNGAGDIDPGSVAGLTALVIQVGTLTTQVAALQTLTTAQGTSITALNGEVTTLQANAVVRNGAGVPAGGLGNINDWYSDDTNKHIYVKTGVAVWTMIV